MLGTLFTRTVLFFFVAATAEDVGCPCLESVPPSAFGRHLSEDGNSLMYQGHKYPLNYGIGQGCKAFDSDPAWLQPHCGDAQGNALPDAPAWCQEKWCYIDPNNCNLPLKFKSGLFPDSELYYSYQTCGSKGTFADWFGEGSSKAHQTTELAQLVEDYVLKARRELEDSYVELSDSASCSVKSSCPCESCTDLPNSAWARIGEAVDLSSSVFIPRAGVTPDSKSQCVSAFSHSIFSRIAASEYTNDERLGWLYGGLQADGSYTQWPAQQWCPNPDWDPRFRPWYSAAASGPKNVVLVLDTSGSMIGDRIKLARLAAKAVLRTLTWRDTVLIIGFSSFYVTSPSGAVSDEMRETLDKWIDSNILAGGGTEFKAPLTKALAHLATKKEGCSNVLLFMTDGESTFFNSDFSDFEREASKSNTVVFGYSLGSGADTRVVQRLACENNGIHHQIADSSTLSHAMSSYYTYFGAASSFRGVRWVQYTDVVTGTELMTACTPLYDRRPERIRDELSFVLGVICMDLSVIVPLDQLKVLQRDPVFLDRLVRDSSVCPVAWNGLDAAAKQRALAKVRDSLRSSGAVSCSAGTNSPDDSTDPDNNNNSNNNSTDPETSGAIIPIAGGLAGVLLIVSVVFCLRKRRSGQNKGPVVVSPPDPQQEVFVPVKANNSDKSEPPPAYTPY